MYYNFTSVPPLMDLHSRQYSSLQSVGALISCCLHEQFRLLEQNVTDVWTPYVKKHVGGNRNFWPSCQIIVYISEVVHLNMFTIYCISANLVRTLFEVFWVPKTGCALESMAH